MTRDHGTEAQNGANDGPEFDPPNLRAVLDGGNVVLTWDPSPSIASLKSARDIARTALSEDWTFEDVAHEFERTSPELARLASWFAQRREEVNRNQLSFLLAIIVFLIMWHKGTQAVKVDQQQLDEAFERVKAPVEECATPEEVEDAVRALLDDKAEDRE